VAVKKVEGYVQILQSARQASTSFLAKDIPRSVMTALEKAIEQLSRHADLAPPYASAAFREEAYRLAHSGRTDANQAVTDLAALVANVKAEADRLQLEKQQALADAALRVMRQHRTDLTKHPLLTRLTDKKRNPFEAPTMMAAAAGLRTLLKEVELQVLDSV
jgi:hypothetical protein